MTTTHGTAWSIPFVPDPSHLAFDSFVSFIVSALLAIMINAEGQAWVATMLGDARPKTKDRFHFNVFWHLDIMGSICYLVGGFGWPKQVDIDPSKFKYPRLFLVLSRFAGAFANILMANVAATFVFIIKFLGMEPLVFLMVAGVNVTTAVYHLIPLPPLAASTLISVWLPDRFKNLFRLAGPFIIVAIFLMERVTNQGIISPYLNPLVWRMMKFITG